MKAEDAQQEWAIGYSDSIDPIPEETRQIMRENSQALEEMMLTKSKSDSGFSQQTPLLCS
jgi:hypothetical protein